MTTRVLAYVLADDAERRTPSEALDRAAGRSGHERKPQVRAPIPIG
ncbi:hypothetical protein [Nocardia australiensis]|nr:hypothetical protein [Nocardia australiensis]